MKIQLSMNEVAMAVQEYLHGKGIRATKVLFLTDYNAQTAEVDIEDSKVPEAKPPAGIALK